MKIIVAILALIVAVNVSCQSQNLKADSALIREAALNYVEGFYRGDTARMAKSMSRELVKRIIDNRSGKSKLMNTNLAELQKFALGQKPQDPNPGTPFRGSVIIYDISSDVALAKITTNKMTRFFDYVQMGKMDGQWKVINVLWAFYK